MSFITGNVSVVAGTGAVPSVSSMPLLSPRGVLWNSHLGLFIADQGNNRVLKLGTSFTDISTVAGSGEAQTGSGPALQVSLVLLLGCPCELGKFYFFCRT